MSEAEAFQAEIIQRYDAPMYRAMLEVYGDQIHPGFFEHPDEDLPTAALRSTARLAEMAGIAAGQRVLETACGVGGSARYLARTFAVDVVATNISKGQLATAAEWTEGSPAAERITYAFADFHALDHADAAFDVYWCQDSLLFSPDRPKALAEAARVLKPGGIIALSDLVVVGTPDAAAAALLDEISEPGFWSMADYRNGLAAAGLTPVTDEDWSTHVLPSFDRIRADIAAKRDRLAEIAGMAEVDHTLERYDLWCRASRTGNLGWAGFVGRKAAP